MYKKNTKNSFSLWHHYNQGKLEGVEMLDQTKIFFDLVPEIKENFEKSNRKIVQFGASAGQFISTFVEKRQVIGYDYSTPAVAALEALSIAVRDVGFR